MAATVGTAAAPTSAMSLRSTSAGRRVGHHGEAEDLGPGVTGGDGLDGHGHADDVGPGAAQHAHLGRRLELRARDLGVHAGPRRQTAAAGSGVARASARSAGGVGVDHVDELGAASAGLRPVRLRWSSTTMTDPVARSSRMPPAAAVRITVEQPAAIPVRRGWTTSAGLEALVEVAAAAQDEDPACPPIGTDQPWARWPPAV